MKINPNTSKVNDFLLRSKQRQEQRAAVENAVASIITGREPYYTAWKDALFTIADKHPDLRLVYDDRGSIGTIWLATELVVKHGVPLEEILTIASLCFAGADKPITDYGL